MILQEEFIRNGYRDLLVGNTASEYGIDLEDFFDNRQETEELLSLFISEQQDELFFLLNGDAIDINTLCDRWDDRIRVFTIINRKSERLRKLIYNIVQLIVYSGDTSDKSREGNLQISRKIIIKGNMTNINQIEIDDKEAIELPFHMIPVDVFAPDEKQINKLQQLIPEDNEVLTFMEKEHKKVNRGDAGNGVLKKSFNESDYNNIKEWLKR